MLVSLFILSIAFVFAQDIKPADSPLEFREFAWDYSSIENRLSAGGVKITLNADGQNNSASADVDFAGFKFVAGSQVAVGFAGLAAHASADWTPGSDGTGKLIYSIAGAWAEIILGFSQIFLYEEKNGEAGFQYNLGDKVWTCLEDGVDCVVPGSAIDVTSLRFDAVASTSAPCPTGNGYNTDCRVWTITTTGYYPLTTTQVFQFTFQVSNQKVLSGNQQIGPDYGKISWKITYPWGLKGDKTKHNVGISGYIGGKAGTAGIVGGVFQGKNGYIFQGDNDKAAVITWDGTATLGSNSGSSKDSAVYVNGISGESILNFDLKGVTDPGTILVISAWQVAVGWATIGGWTSELVILSWDGVGPDSVLYDPTFGMAATSEVQTGGSSFLMPSFLSLVCTLVLSRLF